MDRIQGLTETELFRSWMAKGDYFTDRDKYMIDGEVCVDFFIRFERLHENIRQFCNQLSIPFEPLLLPEFKKGKRSDIPVMEYDDEKTRQIVEEKYAWELREFSYSI